MRGKVYGSLAFNVIESVVLEGYADYNFRLKVVAKIQ